jgi:hypothetical protein
MGHAAFSNIFGVERYIEEDYTMKILYLKLLLINTDRRICVRVPESGDDEDKEQKGPVVQDSGDVDTIRPR